MRIEAMEIYRVAMPLIYPFRTAYGDGHVIESLLVKLRSGEWTGWGEATPWESPLYSSEWAEGAYVLLGRWLAPQLLGQEIDSAEQLQAKLSLFKGNYFAKASLDLAWWDLQARQQNTPLWKLLGGQSDVISVGADFGVMDSMDELLEAIQGAITAGFKRVKLKFRPGWDLDMVRTVRKAFPDMVFHVDCNSAYRLDAKAIFQALDAFGLAMIEQPLAHDDLLDHAKLQQIIDTPICLDESITSVEKARKAIELGACRWFNIKPGRVGGLTPAIQILRLAEQAGIPCWIGGMLESAVGASFCIALATLPNIHYPNDVFPSRRFYEQDLSLPEIALDGPGRIRAFEGAGIGCIPDENLLRARTLQSCCLTA